MSAIPLSEFKAHLNITRTADDAEIQRVLDAAESWANHYTGGRLGGGTATFTARSAGGSVLVLPALGLASVTGITDPLGVTTVLLNGADHDLRAGIIALPYRLRGTWTVTVTFPTEIPADLKLAVLIVGKHLWETQRLAGQSEGARPGFGSGTNQAATPPMGFAVPSRALELAAPYWAPGTA